MSNDIDNTDLAAAGAYPRCQRCNARVAHASVTLCFHCRRIEALNTERAERNGHG